MTDAVADAGDEVPALAVPVSVAVAASTMTEAMRGMGVSLVGRGRELARTGGLCHGG